VPLSLALHELATNAVKYGALSAAGGRVSLAWALADGVMRLVWREAGGPPVAPPRRRGMGTQLLRPQAGLAAVEVEYRADGVRCEIAIEGVGG
jgi:two-component sensor histidine kinase